MAGAGQVGAGAGALAVLEVAVGAGHGAHAAESVASRVEAHGMAQPDSCHSKPALSNTRCRPSASAAARTGGGAGARRSP